MLRKFVLAIVIPTLLFLSGKTGSAASTGTWTAAKPLNVARSGATATLISDGRVLVTGGLDSSGNPTSSVEIYNVDGTATAAASMTAPRAGHAAIALPNNEVLITGGVSAAAGSATNSAEIYDPAQNTWTAVSGMGQARSGHTLSLLLDGTVLVAGGTNASGGVSLLETFDPTTNSFTARGTLATPRANHAAAVLPDGRVMVIGGISAADMTTSLSSTEIFDPAAGTVTAGPSLNTARSGHTATTTLNGTVVVIGGTNPSLASNGSPAELATAEVFDPSATTRAFTQSASKLATARAGHLAFLLPHNANILIMGGTAAGASLSSVEMYTAWTDTFQGTGSLAAARSAAAGTALLSATGAGTEGALLVTGGQNSAGTLASGELYSFATVKTDAADYPPGDIVTITGTGWQPGETVKLAFREYPNIDTPGPYTTVADSNGNILDVEFAPDLNDIGERFYLTAVGSSSGLQVQHTFTDKVATDTSLTCTPLSTSTWTCTATTVPHPPVTSSLSGMISFTVSPSGGGSFSPSACSNLGPSNPISCTTTFTLASGFPTITATYVSSDQGKNTSGSSATFTITPALLLDTPNPASVAHGSTGAVAFTSHLTANGGTPIAGVTVTFAVDGSSVGTGVTNASGTATLSTYNPSALSAGPHIVQASFPAGSFAGAQYTSGTSNQQTLTVNQISTTTSIAAPAITYGQNGSVTVTVTSASGTPAGSVALSFNGGTAVSKALDSTGAATFTNSDISALNTPAANTSGYPLSATYTPQSGSGLTTSSGTGTLTVNQAPLLITASSGTMTYGGTVPTITATFANFVNNDTVTSLGTGFKCATTATSSSPVSSYPSNCSGAVNANYNISYVAGTLTVNQAQLTITASSPSMTYGGPVPAITASYNGFIPGESYNSLTTQPACSTTATATSPVTTGGYPTNCTGAVDANYSISYVPGTLTINPLAVTLTAGSYSGTYDGSTHTLSACASSAASFVTCANSPAGPVGPDVGSATVTPTPVYAQGSVAADYTITANNGSWSITPLAVTLTGGSLTAVYNGSAQSPSACGSSKPSFVTCTNSPTSVGPDVVTAAIITPVPVYAPGSVAADYAITSNNGSATITALAVTVTGGSYSGIYDGSTHALTACSSSYSGVTCANNPAGPVGPNVGGPTAVVPVPAVSTGIAADYTITANNGSWSITPLAVTLTAGSLTAVYNGSAQSPSACGSSKPSFVTCTNSPTSVGPDVVTAATITPVPVYAPGSVAADYTITSNNGSATISALAVTVSGGSYSGTYDGSTHTLSACASSAATFVTCANSPAGPVGPDVGSATVTPTPVYAQGSVAADYTITANNGSWSITPLAVTLTAGSLTAVYNGSAQSPSACTSTKSTFVTCTNSPATVGPDVVTAAIIAPVPVYAPGSVAADYAITSNNGSATITALAVTVTGGSYSGTYDGSTHALSPCSSDYAGVTCANNPAGPVGPNVGGPTAVVPVPAVSTGIAADYTITANNGSWSITPLAVTLTAGSLNNAVYNGSPQSVPSCTSSAATFVTCTNNPASVGPDVSSGTIGVSSTYNYVKGNSNDYAITPVGGSWSIIPLSVTVTAGNYNNVYDGATHSPTSCVSTSALLPCTDSPSIVGPNVGEGTVVPTLGTYNATDFTINRVNGAWSITAFHLNATVAISQPNPAAPTTAYQYSDPAIITVSFTAPGPIPNLTVTTATVSFGTQTFANLKFSCNSATPVVCSASTVAPPDASAVYLLQAPGSYTVTTSYPSGFDTNFAINAPTTIFSIVQEDAAVTYTGNSYFSVPPTQTTVTIPVSFTLQDATATGTGSAIYDAYPGDITKTGTVNITLSGSYIGSNGTTSNYSANCSNVVISAVPGAVGSNGLPSTALTGSCSFPSVPASAGTYQLIITPAAGSYYTFPSGYDTNIQISTDNGGSGFITGGGYQTATYLNSNATGSTPPTAPAGYLLGGKLLAGKLNFGYMAKYNRSGSNLQASVNVIVRTHCMSSTDLNTLGVTGYTPKPGDDGLCAYQIKSNRVISMSDVAYLSACTTTSTTCSPGYGVLVVGANLQDVTGPTPISVTGNLQLQLTMYDNGEPGSGTNATPAPDTLTLHLTDSRGNLWFSNSWTGTKTLIVNGPATRNAAGAFAPTINGGNLQVH